MKSSNARAMRHKMHTMIIPKGMLFTVSLAMSILIPVAAAFASTM